jgi:hypothetical protein
VYHSEITLPQNHQRWGDGNKIIRLSCSPVNLGNWTTDNPPSVIVQIMQLATGLNMIEENKRESSALPIKGKLSLNW